MKTVWSKPVESGTIAEALEAGKFPAINSTWHLNEFEDMSNPRNGTDDLYFRKAQSQEIVERPPREIVSFETTYWGVGALGTGFALLPLLMLYGCYRLGRGYLSNRRSLGS